MLETFIGLKSTAQDTDIIVSKANYGIPEFKDGALTYSSTLDVMADYARLAAGELVPGYWRLLWYIPATRI